MTTTTTTTDIFERAAKSKLRFETARGLLATEDLFDLPIQSATKVSLDGLAVEYYKELQKASQAPVSFVTAPSTTVSASDILQLKFDIVKHVLDLRVAEQQAKQAEAQKAEKRRQLQELIEKKKLDQLEGTSLEDLEKQLELLK